MAKVKMGCEHRQAMPMMVPNNFIQMIIGTVGKHATTPKELYTASSLPKLGLQSAIIVQRHQQYTGKSKKNTKG